MRNKNAGMHPGHNANYKPNNMSEFKLDEFQVLRRIDCRHTCRKENVRTYAFDLVMQTAFLGIHYRIMNLHMLTRASVRTLDIKFGSIMCFY